MGETIYNLGVTLTVWVTLPLVVAYLVYVVVFRR